MKILLLGGMGPQASLHIHKRLIDCAAAHGAVTADQYPQITHISVPSPHFIAETGSMHAAAQRVNQALAVHTDTYYDAVIVACNTAHLLLHELRLPGPIFSLADFTKRALLSQSPIGVGLLASSVTIESRLFGTLITLDRHDQQKMEGLILDVIANKPHDFVKRQLDVYTRKLVQKGATTIVLGCTELSVIADSAPAYIDPVELVVQAIFERSEV